MVYRRRYGSILRLPGLRLPPFRVAWDWSHQCKGVRSKSELSIYIRWILLGLTHLIWQANYNRLLDVARETYKENVGDIFALCNALAEMHGLPISLIYQESGFVFSMKRNDLEGELPRGFVNVSIKKGKVIFSSMELVKTSGFLPTSA